MLLSDYAVELLERIKRKNKKHLVTVGGLLEYREYAEMTKITDGLKELREAGEISTKSIVNYGRFENEIVLRDGHVEHKGSKAIVKEERKTVGKKPRQVIQKRTVTPQDDDDSGDDE